MTSNLLQALNDCLLEQMVTSPTRGRNILDLFLTRQILPSWTMYLSLKVIPGLYDHDVVFAHADAKPETTKQVPHIIPLHKKADCDQTVHEGCPF